MLNQNIYFLGVFLLVSTMITPVVSESLTYFKGSNFQSFVIGLDEMAQIIQDQKQVIHDQKQIIETFNNTQNEMKYKIEDQKEVIEQLNKSLETLNTGEYNNL